MTYHYWSPDIYTTPSVHWYVTTSPHYYNTSWAVLPHFITTIIYHNNQHQIILSRVFGSGCVYQVSFSTQALRHLSHNIYVHAACTYTCTRTANRRLASGRLYFAYIFRLEIFTNTFANTHTNGRLRFLLVKDALQDSITDMQSYFSGLVYLRPGSDAQPATLAQMAK